jgi:hypothetical protein
MWEFDKILEIMILRIIDGLPLTKSHYIDKVIKKYGYEDKKKKSQSQYHMVLV